MELAIRETLSGKPRPGQKIVLELESGEEYTFICEPHEKYYSYIWRLEGQSARVLHKLFPKLKATWTAKRFDPRWYAVFIESDGLIAVDEPLRLRAVPKGIGVADTTNEACLSRIAGIEIK